eukprot:TRINITY_DN12962_c0_g1_i1.p1 TRINITY_DN12962_c0_g1~~TRINITY_DN12962_c0_g1_i1.p1  ORF type:complete len:84 (-),score=11.30 TRINITY_DN12962_c0_g1_i1:156-407(-)
MGGKKYKKHPLYKLFKDLCCKAFKCSQTTCFFAHKSFCFDGLCGIPNLMDTEPIYYLHVKVTLRNKSEKEDKTKYYKERNYKY